MSWTTEKYRVSIKSFPDYKHLLQENYVEYKYIFYNYLSQFLKFSNKMVHLHTGVHVFVGFWMQHFQTGGMGEMVQHPGHHDRRISHPPLPDFFLWGYVKDKVFSTPVPDITNLKARITDAFATITEDMLENTWREVDYPIDVLRATKGAHVEVY